MSCKSAVYTANVSTLTATANSIIPLGQVVRKYGCDINVMPNSIILKGAGYYMITATVTTAPTAAATVNVTMLKDGVAVPGAEATQTTAAASKSTTLNFTAIVRKTCCAEASNVIFVIDTAGQISNVAITVVKI